MNEDVSRETPRLVIAIRQPVPDLAAGVARTAAELLSRPSFRAGVAGSAVTGAICMRAGMRPLPTFLLMLMAHGAAERLYGMAEDIHQTAVMQQTYLNEQLRKQGQEWLDAHPGRAGQAPDGPDDGGDPPG